MVYSVVFQSVFGSFAFCFGTSAFEEACLLYFCSVISLSVMSSGFDHLCGLTCMDSDNIDDLCLFPSPLLHPSLSQWYF